MKKIIRILSVCMLAFVCVVMPFGCAAKTDGRTEQKVQNDDAVLVDFESYTPDLSTCRISSNFGKVSLNRDAKYVKSGSLSARIDPVGNGWMYFPTYSETYEFDYTDFTNIRCVRIEMYNPQEETKTVRVGLIAKISSIDSFDSAGEKTFELKNGWNTLEYYIDSDIICMTADITDIQGVSLVFEKCDAWDISETTPRYYIDEIKLVKSTIAHSVQSNIEFGENEIMNFEKDYHQSFIVNDFGIEMGIVKTADYGVATKTGRKALRMVIPEGNSGAWNYYMKISAPYLKASALGKITDDKLENAYLAWDTYSGATSEYNCVCLFFLGSSTASYAVGSFPKPGEWVTHKIKLADVEAHLPGWRSNVGQFVFSIKDDYSADRELFIDNFRIEYSE